MMRRRRVLRMELRGAMRTEVMLMTAVTARMMLMRAVMARSDS